MGDTQKDDISHHERYTESLESSKKQLEQELELAEQRLEAAFEDSEASETSHVLEPDEAIRKSYRASIRHSRDHQDDKTVRRKQKHVHRGYPCNLHKLESWLDRPRSPRKSGDMEAEHLDISGINEG